MHIICVTKATTYIQEETNSRNSLKDNVSQPKTESGRRKYIFINAEEFNLQG